MDMKDISRRVAIALRDDLDTDMSLSKKISAMTPNEVGTFIKMDMANAFSRQPGRVVFVRLRELLYDVARDVKATEPVKVGMGAIDIGGVIGAALSVATSVGSVYLQKRATDQQAAIMRRQQELEAQAAQAAAAGAAAFQAKAVAEATKPVSSSPGGEPSVAGLPGWLIPAGIAAVAILAVVFLGK